jgi:acyl-CoA synthetase (AMP-forming)/AMP-acid ligase II
LYLTGRLKELIKVNAYSVAPTELEILIAGHPAVADVAVVGRPHEKAGEMPVPSWCRETQSSPPI